MGRKNRRRRPKQSPVEQTNIPESSGRPVPETNVPNRPEIGVEQTNIPESSGRPVLETNVADRPETDASADAAGSRKESGPESSGARCAPVPSKKLETTESGKNAPVPLNRPVDGKREPMREVILLANHFPVSFDESIEISQYDLDMKLANRNVTIENRELCVRIFSKLLTRFPLPPETSVVHDGKKNMYSSRRLEDLRPFYEVGLEDGAERPNTQYNVTVEYTSTNDGSFLRNFLNVRNPHGVNFKEFQAFLQGLEIVIREHPSKNKLLLGRSLYTQVPDERVTRVGSGAITLKGFYQSLRPTANGLALVVDSSVGIFYDHTISVIEYLQQSDTVACNNKSQPLSEAEVRYAEKALKGLKVTVTHRQGHNQKHTVRCLSRDITKDITFERNSDGTNGPGHMVRIVDYFRQKYQCRIQYELWPCLDLGKSPDRPNYVPMELCRLCVGQRVPRDKFKLKGGNYQQAPRERLQKINGYMVGRDGPTSGPFIAGFRLRVDQSMTNVTGRVLKAPKVKLKVKVNDRKLKDMEVDPGQNEPRWNFRSNLVLDGKQIKNWCVMNFATSDTGKIKNFTDSLVKRCGEVGIKMNAQPIQNAGNYTMDDLNNAKSLEEELRKAKKICGEKQPLIVICVMEKKHPGYHTLKLIAETKVGLVTQCCLYSNIKDPKNSKDKSPYLANLALKMNAKMGGINSSLADNISIQLPGLSNPQVMYIGADVNHPNPGDNDSPSVAAVVGSVNWPDCNRYIAKIRYQTRRKEQIEQLEDMSKELLDDYRNNSNNKNKRLPDSILYFRDGVSEGQFDMVLTQELSALKAAADKFDDYKPRISIIVAQKRHHTRLFRQKPSEENTNIPAGTVVDTKIVHPHQFDFYLCSHYAAIGTSRPTHYHVLMDENKFTSDALQKLINNLCYTFQRCTSPVSLVPPVYYADLAAYRGRCYLYGMSFTSSSPSNYPTLHDQVKKTMFFC